MGARSSNPVTCTAGPPWTSVSSVVVTGNSKGHCEDKVRWLFSGSVMSDSLRRHELQHTRLPQPSPSPRACSNSCPLSQWCHPIICPVLLLSSTPPSIRVFSKESALLIRWPKHWSFSFSISPSNEYSGLISFRMDWFDLLAVQGTLKSLLQHHSSKSSILSCSAFFMVQLSASGVCVCVCVFVTNA